MPLELRIPLLHRPVPSEVAFCREGSRLIRLMATVLARKDGISLSDTRRSLSRSKERPILVNCVRICTGPQPLNRLAQNLGPALTFFSYLSRER